MAGCGCLHNLHPVGPDARGGRPGVGEHIAVARYFALAFSAKLLSTALS